MTRKERRRAARIEAFDQVPETCPRVYDAMNRATEEILKETKALRAALILATERAQKAENQLARLKKAKIVSKFLEDRAFPFDLDNPFAGLIR